MMLYNALIYFLDVYTFVDIDEKMYELQKTLAKEKKELVLIVNRGHFCAGSNFHLYELRHKGLVDMASIIIFEGKCLKNRLLKNDFSIDVI